MARSHSQSIYRGNSEAELERLLGDRLDHPNQAATIDNRIRELFFETYAVLVLDSSGFSRNAQRQGIITALAEVERMRRALVPLFTHQNGKIFKLEVDNIYALFPTVTGALAVSEEALARLTPLGIRVSIGIGYGELIMIEQQEASPLDHFQLNHYQASQPPEIQATVLGEGRSLPQPPPFAAPQRQPPYSNVYGIEMNLASKLGEDVAEADEIWLTESAFQQLQDPAGLWEGHVLHISHFDLKAYRYGGMARKGS